MPGAKRMRISGSYGQKLWSKVGYARYIYCIVYVKFAKKGDLMLSVITTYKKK